jgi:hypothetical protein
MITPTYRLPDSLGGHPCQIVDENNTGEVVVKLTVDGLTMTLILLGSHLVRVKPELPPEPPHASVVLSGPVDAGVARAWQRDDFGPDNNEEARWYQAGGRLAISWAHLCMVKPPVLLIPDPAAGAEPRGEWQDADRAVSAKLYIAAGGAGITDLALGGETIQLSREDAESAGRTLLAAARQP